MCSMRRVSFTISKSLRIPGNTEEQRLVDKESKPDGKSETCGLTSPLTTDNVSFR